MEITEKQEAKIAVIGLFDEELANNYPKDVCFSTPEQILDASHLPKSGWVCISDTIPPQEFRRLELIARRQGSQISREDVVSMRERVSDLLAHPKLLEIAKIVAISKK